MEREEEGLGGRRPNWGRESEAVEQAEMGLAQFYLISLKINLFTTMAN